MLEKEKRNAYARQYYANNKEKQKIANRKYSRANWDRVLIHYGNKCQCCGEGERIFLTVDHVNGDGAEHRKISSIRSMAQWLVKNNFPLGYQILCYNCNCGKARNEGVCPHEMEK